METDGNDLTVMHFTMASIKYTFVVIHSNTGLTFFLELVPLPSILILIYLHKTRKFGIVQICSTFVTQYSGI